MKRIISFLLVGIMLISSSLSFAAPGDFIHTGLKRYYDVKNDSDLKQLIADLKKEDKDKFYREVGEEDGVKQYVNVRMEEEEHENVLKDFLIEKGITAGELVEFLQDPKNSSAVEDLAARLDDRTDEKSISFEGIEDEGKGDFGEYVGDSSNSLKLTPGVNYSTPQPGPREGTTQFATLNSFNASSKWMYKVSETSPTPPKADEVVSGTVYLAGGEIPVKEDDNFIILYATDLRNKIKGYAIIEITEGMVSKPREEANKLDSKDITISPGTTMANAIKINGVPLEGDWKYFVKSNELTKIYKDDNFEAELFKNGNDIPMANGSKYVYLINLDEDEKIDNYYELMVEESDLSKLPNELEKGTHYTGPSPGDTEGTTKFSNLNTGSTGGTQWMYRVGKDLSIPIENSPLDSPFEAYSTDESVKVDVGDNLILAAVDGSKQIKAYKMFTLDESNISGTKAPTFSITAEKGKDPGTTMVRGLTFPEGATKWMYAAGEDMSQPYLDRLYEGSKDYRLGNDINAKDKDTLYILATDNIGRVKEYGVAELDEDMVKAPPAMPLLPGTHYRNIEKGGGIGTTNIVVNTSDALNKLLDNEANLEWKYIISKDRPSIPELNLDAAKLASDLLEIHDLDSVNSIINVADETAIKAEDAFPRNLLLLATEDVDGVNKVKGYAIISLTRKDVKFPDAPKLVEIKDGKGNYSLPVKGNQPGTTKIVNLQTDKIDNHSAWYSKVVTEPLTIEYKQSKNDFGGFNSSYSAGRDIAVKDEKYIVLISADSKGNVLSYENIPVGETTADYASEMKPVTNYVGPVPGSKAGSTKFTTFHGLPAEDDWFYKKVDQSAGKIISGITVKHGEDGFISFGVNDDIENVKINDWILLIRTNKSGEVTGYANIQLRNENIRGQDLSDLREITGDNPNGNFAFAAGSRPGTTKITNLNLGGIDGSPHSGWKWMYKVIDSKLEGTDIPYLNQKVSGANNYTPGNDIDIVTPDTDYILLLATDSGGQAKAYAQIKVSGKVQDSAPTISATLATGSRMDTVKVEGLNDGSKVYKSLVTKTRPMSPAKGDSVTENAQTYDPDSDISIRVGEFLTIYQVDGNKIEAFVTFEIIKDNISTGSAVLGDDVVTPENYIFLEGNIVNGGSQFKIALTGAKWIEDIKTNKIARDKLFNGFKADNQTSEWSKVVTSMINDGSGSIIRNSDNLITILLPRTLSYDIAEEQKISLTIPSDAIDGALNPITTNGGSLTIKPTVKATISGTVVSSIVREEDIKAGGATIEIQLEDGEWAAFDEVKKIALIGSFSPVGESSGTNWTRIKTALEGKLENIVRNDSKNVTITLPPVAGVKFGSDSEIISLRIAKDSGLVVNATEDIVASPNFTLYPNMIKVEGESEKDTSDKDIAVVLMAPDFKVLDPENNTWIIKVTSGTLNPIIDNNNVIISGLPKGLKADVSKGTDNTIEIKLSGTASASLASDTIVKVKVKGSGVSELNSVDSDDIELKLVRGDSIMDLLKKIRVNVVDGRFMDGSLDPMVQLLHDDVEYSFNSTTGINGDWEPITDKKIDFKAGRIFVRQGSNPRVFYEILPRLVHPKAPTGISVSEVDYSVADKVKVKLSGFDDDLDYEILTHSEDLWKDYLHDPQGIELDKNSDLRIRLKATDHNLASESTPKLNGLYLGDVKLAVGSGLIQGTSTSIEFARNLENVSEKKWTTTKAGETPVDFKEGDVIWIRQKGSEVNYRKFDKITAKDVPTSTGITYDIKAGKVNNTSDQSLEYRISNGQWKSLDAQTTVDEIFAPGPIEIRTKGESTILPSGSVILDTIPSPIDPPELKGNDSDKTISYLDENGSWKQLDNNFQYKAGANGSWKPGSGFSADPDRNKTIVIYVRKVAEAKKLPSNEKPISFTQNLTFENVRFDIANKLILGTTKDMEFSVNSKDVKNGIWKPAGIGQTTIEPFEGMYIWLREKNKPSTEKPFIENLARKVKPDLSKVYFNIETNKLSNQSASNLEYRINNGSWIKIDANTDLYGVNFVPGKLEYRQRATTDKMESHPEFNYLIGAKSSGPGIVIDDVDNKILNVILPPGLENKDLEYRINNSPWISGELLDTEDFTGEKKVEVRIRATKFKLASNISEVNFTKNLELDHVRLSTHVKPFKLNGVTKQMAYSINGAEWKLCEPDEFGDSKLFRQDGVTYLDTLGPVREIWIRDSLQPENQRLIYEP